MSKRISLRSIWLSYFKDYYSYNTFREYIKENLDEFKDVLWVKQNDKKMTFRVLDKDKFVELFNKIF